VFGSAIREATERDYPTFLKLWIEFIENQAALGGDMLATPKTLSFFSTLFNTYLSGERRGVTLMAGDDWGVSLWGEDLGDSPIDTKYAPFARGWGTYVVPARRREGLGSQMREHGARRMHEMGFTHIGGTILLANDVSLQSLKKYNVHTPMLLHIKALEEL
jgi:GNAT superfamily N-acetyltransferase